MKLFLTLHRTKRTDNLWLRLELETAADRVFYDACGPAIWGVLGVSPPADLDTWPALFFPAEQHATTVAGLRERAALVAEMGQIYDPSIRLDVVEVTPVAAA